MTLEHYALHRYIRSHAKQALRSVNCDPATPPHRTLGTRADFVRPGADPTFTMRNNEEDMSCASDRLRASRQKRPADRTEANWPRCQVDGTVAGPAMHHATRGGPVASAFHMAGYGRTSGDSCENSSHPVCGRLLRRRQGARRIGLVAEPARRGTFVLVRKVISRFMRDPRARPVYGTAPCRVPGLCLDEGIQWLRAETGAPEANGWSPQRLACRGGRELFVLP